MSKELNNNEEQEINALIKMLEDLNSNDNGTSEINYNSLFDTIGLDFQELEDEIKSYVPKLDVSYKKSNENTIDPKYVYESDSGFVYIVLKISGFILLIGSLFLRVFILIYLMDTRFK